MDGIKLSFDNKVLDYIVEKSIEFKLGARGLRSICEAIMIDAMFDMPSQEAKEIHVNLDYAKEKFEKTDIKRLRAA
jgi:ATP-dependent Clp protease ATP-binding subunit ClpX